VTKRLFVFLAIFVTGLSLIATEARADLTITPKRVVFSARTRSTEVILLNVTDHANTYRLGWQMMKALPDGKYKMMPYNRDTDKDPHSVPNMVVYSPRQVTIEAHGHQTIRLSLRRPADLPPGEYRAHLEMTRLAPAEPLHRSDAHAKTLSMELDVNLSFSIPVIVRQGEDKALKVSLSDPKLRLADNGAVLDVNINRDAGAFSSYGDVNVYWQPPKGKEILIGSLDNVALYPEVKSRQVSVQISAKENLSAGTIRVAYIGKLEAEGTTWAERTFAIGK
jgi:fimbrial chaperone protein